MRRPMFGDVIITGRTARGSPWRRPAGSVPAHDEAPDAQRLAELGHPDRGAADPPPRRRGSRHATRGRCGRAFLTP
ncbi:hypothetical protein EXY23_09100 [Roseicella aquatilis]|uniref:Uncharacterized protein n=1 Tax=Roseicella aquatilis TaxID=2527868 RepID=A0A4R4DPC4_9PROT|nr:hypothetical protein EXY23_09100 [Roseicella aquatilis]